MYSPWTREYLRHTAARIESEGALSSPEHRRELLKIATRIEAMANEPDDPDLSGTQGEPTTSREAKEAHAERLRNSGFALRRSVGNLDSGVVAAVMVETMRACEVTGGDPHLEVLAGALRAELLTRLLENDALLNPEKYR